MLSLFKTIESRFKSSGLSDDKWYILVTATIAASCDPELADQLYTYLIHQPQNRDSATRKTLIRHIREALIKCVSIIGVCKPLESIMAISKVERAEDRDYSCSREQWQCDAHNHERGTNWFRALYTRNAGDTVGLFDAHRDFAWVSTEITYGLYLSDRQILDDLDTQLVVLPAIMMQNLRMESHWHMRGTRRLGVSKEDVEMIYSCVQLVAEFFAMSLGKIPSVEEVEYDV
ncbi:hypothetical protein N7451_001720 [Penicillium sp. IBT 35674x]|nr:hypothetical protein N7451_001720 [Penicillium sp. IBT 35674x]